MASKSLMYPSTFKDIRSLSKNLERHKDIPDDAKVSFNKNSQVLFISWETEEERLKAIAQVLDMQINAKKRQLICAKAEVERLTKELDSYANNIL